MYSMYIYTYICIYTHTFQLFSFNLFLDCLQSKQKSRFNLNLTDRKWKWRVVTLCTAEIDLKHGFSASQVEKNDCSLHYRKTRGDPFTRPLHLAVRLRDGLRGLAKSWGYSQLFPPNSSSLLVHSHNCHWLTWIPGAPLPQQDYTALPGNEGNTRF